VWVVFTEVLVNIIVVIAVTSNLQLTADIQVRLGFVDS